MKATDGFHYGNLWWSLPERGAFMARGRHSQIILVLPKLGCGSAFGNLFMISAPSDRTVTSRRPA